MCTQSTSTTKSRAPFKAKGVRDKDKETQKLTQTTANCSTSYEVQHALLPQITSTQNVVCIVYY